VRILGELAMSGAIPVAAVLWATRCIVRDVLEHRRDLAVLRRTPDDQLADVVRALGAARRRTRQ
jgi:hypothetical protein